MKAVQELIRDALTSLQRKSTDDPEKHWFTRSVIAGELEAPSKHLNPSRKGALQNLVDGGLVEMRAKPNDAKKVPEYRLVR